MKPLRCISSLSPSFLSPLSSFLPCFLLFLFRETHSRRWTTLSCRGMGLTLWASSPPAPIPSLRVPAQATQTEPMPKKNRPRTSRTTSRPSWRSGNAGEWYRTGNRPEGHAFVNRDILRTYGTRWIYLGLKIENWTTGCSFSFTTVTAWEPKTSGSCPNDPCSVKN